MNTLYRYLKWDGLQQEFRFKTEDVFNEFSNFLMEGWTPDEALEWILKRGISGSTIQVIGIDELRSELSKLKDLKYQQYNLNNALSEIADEIMKIVARELAAIRNKFCKDEMELLKRENLIKNLPDKISLALKALSQYDFVDPEAKNRFDTLMNRLNDVKKIEDFIDRHGQRFSGQSSIGFQDTLDLINSILDIEEIEHNLTSGEFGDVSLKKLGNMISENTYHSFVLLRDLQKKLENAGFITTKGRKMELSPIGIRILGERALRDIFSSLKKYQFGGHETALRGYGTVRPENSKEYEYGDPFNLNVVGTLRNSLLRRFNANKIKISPEDFEIYDLEYQTQSTSAVLLDLSWSMSFQGRFPAAKRVALALDHLIRSKYPRDNFYMIGFSTRAKVLSTNTLVRTTWDSNDPFTNIQEALQLASRLISRHRTPNRQIILITDGQPTAYFVDGYLQVELPMFFGGLSPRATLETLKEVKNLTRNGITINTFMLDDSLSLRRFVEEMTRINKGRAFYTTPTQLGRFLLVDYLKRKRKVL